jgi:hypothetical protein
MKVKFRISILSLCIFTYPINFVFAKGGNLSSEDTQSLVAGIESEAAAAQAASATQVSAATRVVPANPNIVQFQKAVFDLLTATPAKESNIYFEIKTIHDQNKSSNIEISEDGQLPGSDEFKTCQKMMGNKLESIYNSASTPVEWITNITQFNCSNKFDSFKTAINAINGDAPKQEEAIQAGEKFKSCLASHLNKIPRCIAVLNIAKAFNKDISNKDHISPSQAQASTQPAVIAANANGTMNISGNSSYDCKSAGFETVDYLACKKFSDYDAGLELATQAFKTGQNLIYQNKAMDTQFEATKNMANDATAALKAQKSNFQDQQAAFTQNSALEGSKAAYLGTIRYSEFPTMQKVSEQCGSTTYNGLWSKDDSIKNFNIDATKISTACQNIINVVTNGRTSTLNVLMNQQASEKMTARCVKLGVNAVAEGINAGFAGKRADQVDGAIANVNGFQPTTTPGLEAAVNTTYCQMNPTAPQCANQQPTQFSTIGDNIVEFGAGGVGAAYGAGTVDNNGTTGATNGAVNNAANGASTKTIGSAIVSVPKDSGIIDPVGAATLSAAKPNAGGGGGGGGASAGSGPGGLPQAQPQGGVSSAIGGGKKESYTAGGGISMLGGRGSMAAAKKGNESGNPFSGLMDKKGPAADKNVNFRGPASVDVGNKGDNIFNMISKRYGWANDQKLMLEYEDKVK